MRVCTRCNTEMIIDDYMKAEPSVGGDGYGIGFAIKIYRKQHEKGFLKHFFDYDSLKTNVTLNTAFCPNCGTVENFVAANNIAKILDALK